MPPRPKTVATMKDVQRPPGREGHVLHDAPWRHETLGKGDRARPGAGDSTGDKRGMEWRRGQARMAWLHTGVLRRSGSASDARPRRRRGGGASRYGAVPLSGCRGR